MAASTAVALLGYWLYASIFKKRKRSGSLSESDGDDSNIALSKYRPNTNVEDKRSKTSYITGGGMNGVDNSGSRRSKNSRSN